jgi:hypothetical protein
VATMRRNDVRRIFSYRAISALLVPCSRGYLPILDNAFLSNCHRADGAGRATWVSARKGFTTLTSSTHPNRKIRIAYRNRADG